MHALMFHLHLFKIIFQSSCETAWNDTLYNKYHFIPESLLQGCSFEEIWWNTGVVIKISCYKESDQNFILGYLVYTHGLMFFICTLMMFANCKFKVYSVAAMGLKCHVRIWIWESPESEICVLSRILWVYLCFFMSQCSAFCNDLFF